MSPAEMLFVITGAIGAVAGAIVSVMTYVHNRSKLETISKDTNGNLSELKREVFSLRADARRER